MGLETVEQLNQYQFGTKMCESLMNRFNVNKSWNQELLVKEVMSNLDFEHFVELMVKELQGRGVVTISDDNTITYPS